MIDRVRRDLTLQLQGDSVFRIYFRGQRPGEGRRAPPTASPSCSSTSNLQLRENQAQGTSTFLEGELEETKHRLEVQEARIAEFKRPNMGDLPEQRDTNLRGVEQLQTKLEINIDALDKAETRKLLLQTQIAEMRRTGGPGPRATSPARPRAPRPGAAHGSSSSGAARRAARPLHRPPPGRDPAQASRSPQLRALERRGRSSAAARPPLPAPDSDRGRRSTRCSRPSSTAIDLEIRSLQAERERILGDIASYQARLENVPRVEQELLSLTRDYDNIRSPTSRCSTSASNAKLYENLEKSQQGEQFTILEKALPPTRRSSPNRLLLLAAGLARRRAAGRLSLALLRERPIPPIATPSRCRQAFPGVPLLATIPRLGAGSDRSDGSDRAGRGSRAPQPIRRAAGGRR